MGVGTITIRKLLQRVADGEIRIPAFQREFVWEPDRVQFLMDSIYKEFPIGTVLFWRTKEKLQHDRELGPYVLPEPKKEYPIEYVLDGQQRITSIFATFQTELPKNPNSSVKWIDIYFDLSSSAIDQDSEFAALHTKDVKEHHFPLRALFDVTEFGRLSRALTDPEQQKKLDYLHARFTEAVIPTETVETEDHSRIALIFERINRGGVPLDTYQLLSAWTWSGDFDLRAKFDELTAELDSFGFSELREEPDLLLKCCAAVLKGEPSVKSIIDLKGSEVRDSFPKFRRGVLGAIDFLRRDCGVKSLKILPYKSMIIPLAMCFATDKTAGFHPNSVQRKALVKWFWASCFSRRYSNSVDTAIAQDIQAFKDLITGNTGELEKRAVAVSPEFFKDNSFLLTSVNTRIFVLLLASANPKSFLSGAKVNLEDVLTTCNRTEFHHIFPNNHLIAAKVEDRSKRFMLANFAFLSQTDNRTIQDKAPTVYKSSIPTAAYNDILTSSLIPQDGLDLSYDEFVEARATLLAEAANRLTSG
jgi:hypothetical protein